MKIIDVYVDDLILMARTLNEVQQMKEGLYKTFKMRDSFVTILVSILK